MQTNSKADKEAMKRIRKCKKLQSKELELYGLKVSSFPLEVFELTWLEDGIFCQMGLSEYPDEFHRLPNLKQLRLGDNNLQVCPPSVGGLKQLKVLRLDIGDSCSPPEFLGDLAQCEELLIDGGSGAFPEFLGRMTALRRILLRYNFITSLPESIGNLVHLERLQIENSYLNCLPDGLKNCISLRSIEVQAPFLMEIPAWLGELPNLCVVSFEGCCIRHVPENLGAPPNVRELWLSGNPLNEEFWNLKRQEDDIWVRWHGKLCRIGIRREEVVVPTSVPTDGSLYSGSADSFQVEHDLLVVQASNTQFLVVPLTEDSSAQRMLLDLCAIAPLNARLVTGVSWRIIDRDRLFLDVYVKMAPNGIRRYLFLVDWRANAVLSSGSVCEYGRDGTLPLLLPGNRIAVDNEYDALVVDLASLQLQGKLFADALCDSEVDHEELQVLGAAQVDDKRIMFHWGQVGESTFETYDFSDESAWRLESRIQVTSDEIESFVRLGDLFLYVEIWVGASNIEESQDAGIYEIGSIRAVNGDVPLLPMLCASVEGLQEVTSSKKRPRLVVTGYDPMLCCISAEQLAYLDPSGNLIVTTLSGDYRVFRPAEDNRFEQLWAWNGRLFARDRYSIMEIDLGL